MEVKKLRETILKTEMPVGEETIEIHYKIGALGAEFTEWLYSPDGAKAGSLYEAIEKSCVYLGITVDGVPVDVTAEALKAAEVPVQVLQAILQHVRREATGGKLGVPSSANI